MPGPSRTPVQLRAIAGTVRPDRVDSQGVELPAVDTVPEPLDWLPNAHAVKEWQRLAPILVANKLLSVGDLSTLGHLCSLHGKIVQLWAAGESPTGHMLAQYNTLAGSFGLAPAWRSKVKPVGEHDAGNPFQKHKQPTA